MLDFETNKSVTGFTLIEAVVAASLFAVVVSSILGVYTSVLRLDSRTRAIRDVSQNSRFIMEFLGKEITNGHIDYNNPNCQNNIGSTIQLCLVNQAGEQEFIWYNNFGLNLSKNSGPFGQAFGGLNSYDTRITNFQFIVSPLEDPYAKLSNEQPHVTVIMEIESSSARDKSQITVQNTFTTKYYPAR